MKTRGWRRYSISLPKFAAGDLTARGTLAGDDSALDGVMAGINTLGEELEARVADNKRTMQTLSESEARFGSLFEAILDGICMADVQTRRFRMANEAICGMLGYSRDELLNLTVDDIHPREDLPNVARQFDRQLKGEINLARLPVKRKDGTVFQADITATPVTVDGQLCITGVFRDVTERIRAYDEIHKLNRTLQEKVQQLLETQDELVRKEINLQLAKELAERQAAEQELHSANEQLSVLLDSLPIAVYRCAAEGDYAVAYMSQNVVSFTGYTAGNFMDQPDLWFSHIHPDDAPRISGEMALLLEKGRHAYEYRWRKADGNYLWLRDSLRLVRFEDGTPNYLVGMWQDITEDRLAAEALRKANDDLSLFRRLLDNSSDAIEVIDPLTRRFLDVNETACRELGYSREELLTMNIHDIDPDMDTDTALMVEEQLGNRVPRVLKPRIGARMAPSSRWRSTWEPSPSKNLIGWALCATSPSASRRSKPWKSPSTVSGPSLMPPWTGFSWWTRNHRRSLWGTRQSATCWVTSWRSSCALALQTSPRPRRFPKCNGSLNVRQKARSSWRLNFRYNVRTDRSFSPMSAVVPPCFFEEDP